MKSYHRLLTSTIARVRGMHAAGKSLEEMIAAGLPAEFAAIGDLSVSSERWIRLVHRSLVP